MPNPEEPPTAPAPAPRPAAGPTGRRAGAAEPPRGTKRDGPPAPAAAHPWEQARKETRRGPKIPPGSPAPPVPKGRPHAPELRAPRTEKPPARNQTHAAKRHRRRRDRRPRSRSTRGRHDRLRRGPRTRGLELGTERGLVLQIRSGVARAVPPPLEAGDSVAGGPTGAVHRHHRREGEEEGRGRLGSDKAADRETAPSQISSGGRKP